MLFCFGSNHNLSNIFSTAKSMLLGKPDAFNNLFLILREEKKNLMKFNDVSLRSLANQRELMIDTQHSHYENFLPNNIQTSKSKLLRKVEKYCDLDAIHNHKMCGHYIIQFIHSKLLL